MNVLKRIAEELMAADYIYDPEHKNKPQQGGWKETEKGWSKIKSPVTAPSAVSPVQQPTPDGQEKEESPAPLSDKEKKNFIKTKINPLLKQMQEIEEDQDFKDAIDKVQDKYGVWGGAEILDALTEGVKFTLNELDSIQKYAQKRIDIYSLKESLGDKGAKNFKKTYDKILSVSQEKGKKLLPKKEEALTPTPNSKLTGEQKAKFDIAANAKTSLVTDFLNRVHALHKGELIKIDADTILKDLKSGAVSLSPEEKNDFIPFILKYADFQASQYDFGAYNALKDIVLHLTPSEEVDKPQKEIKKPKKDAITPNDVLTKMHGSPEFINPKQKQDLVKKYQKWLNKNKDSDKPDIVGKVEQVRTAIKMLTPPKFKKTTPKLTDNTKFIIQDNGLEKDEIQELTGFKDTIKNHPQMSDKEYKERIESGMRLPRNQAQLKAAFVMHMNPMNYDSVQAYQNAKERVQKMSVNDFGKLLASIMSDDEANAVEEKK